MPPDEHPSSSYPDLSGPNREAERTLIPSEDTDPARCLAGGGEMGARIRSFDWASTPLGPIDEWPSNLREAVGFCLRLRFQLATYWGPQLTLVHNDVERDVLGTMQPGALYRPAADVLADMWARADDYLVKPFSARELTARAGTHLEMARIRREAGRRESELRAEARQAQEKVAAILESITDGFIALDREWRFTHVNAEAERINGMRREDHVGRSQWELFPATRGTILEYEWRRAVAEQVAVQFEFYYEPRDSWSQYKAYPTKDGGLSVFFHDITARKRSEEVHRKTHHELEERVRERTQELSRANARLGQQIAKRKQVQEARTELLRRLVRAQEEEHRRIARELHDDLTQRLAVLAIDAGRLEQLSVSPPDVGEKARDIREQLVALSESVHSLSRQLHPSILDDLGLVDALRSECLSLHRRDGVAVEYTAQNVPTNLPRHVALCVYRVAQEALRNVARHARSPWASVRLVANEQELVLRVRDRGVGFEVATRGKTGLGLESMRERARLIHARLRVRSRAGEGTQITVRVPIHRSQS